MPHPARNAVVGRLSSSTSTRPTVCAVTTTPTNDSSTIDSRRPIPSGMPNTSATARTATTGPPSASARPHPADAHGAVRPASALRSRPRGATNTNSKPSSNVDTATASHDTNAATVRSDLLTVNETSCDIRPCTLAPAATSTRPCASTSPPICAVSSSRTDPDSATTLPLT